MRHGLLLLLSLISATAAAEIRVGVVLDSSQQMWARLTDRRPGFVAARMALSSWILERASDDDLALELRLIGGESSATGLGGCQGLTVVVPLGPPTTASWLSALDDVRAIGPRPVLLGVAATAESLGPGPDPRRIVLITAGEDSCFGDRQAAVDALSSGTELRVVGVGLSDDAVKRFGEIAPTRNATSTMSLLAALRWAVEELPSATPAAAPVRIGLGAVNSYAKATLVHEITGGRRELEMKDDHFRGEALPGTYALELSRDQDSPPDVLEGIQVAAGSGLELDLALQLPPPLPDLEVLPERAWSGGPVFASFGSVGSGTFEVALVRPDEPNAAWLERASASGPEATVDLRVPDEPGEVDLRLVERRDDGIRRTIARTQLEIADPDVVLDAPPEIRPFEALPVTWTGPDNPGDRLSLVPAEGEGSDSASCVLTSSGSPAQLTAPGEVGFWEVRYLSGLTGRTFAHARIEVTAVIVTLDAPDEVAAGRTFDVAWEGPAGTADYLGLAIEGGPDDDYVELFLASRGSPARFTAPRELGSYEIRYVEGDTGRVRRRAQLSVIDTPVRLKGPRKVHAGTRFEVRWSGPDRPGDFVAVAKPGAAPEQSEDWAYTSLGSPASLAAPFDAGSYEIRYVTGKGQEILDTIPVQVE